jgi:hypothetical protein
MGSGALITGSDGGVRGISSLQHTFEGVEMVGFGRRESEQFPQYRARGGF